MNLRDKNILVTGGTGFIGSHIVNKLIKEDCFVNIISLPEDNIWRLDSKSNYTIFKANLENPSEIEKCINQIKPEIIFHLAGYVNNNRDVNLIPKLYSSNLDMTINLILSLKKIDYDLFINTGSSEEYGNLTAPFKEIFREKPISPYSASKVAATYFCEMMAYIFKKPIITVRPFLPYGPKQITRAFIPSLIHYGIEKEALSLTPCEQTRDFIFIEDLVDAYISLADNAKEVKKRGIFNIGSGKEIQIKNIVDIIKKKLKGTKFLIGNKSYRPGVVMHHYASIEKINKLIGWSPKWNIEDGIEKTLEWWQSNREIWKK